MAVPVSCYNCRAGLEGACMPLYLTFPCLVPSCILPYSSCLPLAHSRCAVTCGRRLPCVVAFLVRSPAAPGGGGCRERIWSDVCLRRGHQRSVHIPLLLHYDGVFRCSSFGLWRDALFLLLCWRCFNGWGCGRLDAVPTRTVRTRNTCVYRFAVERMLCYSTFYTWFVHSQRTNGL